MRRRARRLRRLLFLLNAVVLTAVVIGAYGFDVLNDPELDTVDARFAIRADRAPPKDLVVVEIDDVTFNELQRRWPFPRSMHGRLIDQLRRDGAKTIAYDVQFTEPTQVEEDNALIDAIDRAKNVVLATTEVDEVGRSNVFGDEGIVMEVGARVGNASYSPDSGGVIRRMPYEVERLKSFSVVAAEAATGRRIRRSDLGGDDAWIDWHGPPGTMRSISFSTALRGDAPPGFFRDKIVVVGAAAPSLQDVHATAVTGNELQPGPEIQAESIATALDGFSLRDVPGAVNVALIVLLGMVGPLAAVALGPARAAVIGVIAAAVYAIAVQIAFNAGWLVDLLYPEASLVLGVVGALAVALILDALRARAHPRPVLSLRPRVGRRRGAGEGRRGPAPGRRAA